MVHVQYDPPLRERHRTHLTRSKIIYQPFPYYYESLNAIQLYLLVTLRIMCKTFCVFRQIDLFFALRVF